MKQLPGGAAVLRLELGHVQDRRPQNSRSPDRPLWRITAAGPLALYHFAPP